MTTKQLLPLFLTFAALSAAEDRPTWWSDPVLQGRIGYDSNPVATGGPTRDAVTFSAGLGLAIATPAAGSPATARLSYAADGQHFAGWREEDFTTHRLAGTFQSHLGAWKLLAEASSLFVDGHDETLTSVPTLNANAVALWRERRAQWQHRAKLLAQGETGRLVTRLSGAGLDYDFKTAAVAGHVPFADRSDVWAGADLGWTQSPHSLWFGGVRLGSQHQDQVPLPGCAFDYSSRYTRLVSGWEGTLGGTTKLAVSAGPDFRHFTGTVDPNLMAGRDRTSLWFETNATTKLGPTLALTTKATRWAWLSSTGKSAYYDLAAETNLAWTATAATALRVGFKAHQCDYYPTTRNDWETLVAFGATRTINPAFSLSADLLFHQGWSALAAGPDRGFSRTVATVGATCKF